MGHPPQDPATRRGLTASRGVTMVRLWLALGIVCMVLLGFCGCGSNSRPVVVQPQSGLERAKGILNDYANGVPLGSEAATFEEVVAEVRQTDQQKATILEK